MQKLAVLLLRFTAMQWTSYVLRIFFYYFLLVVYYIMVQLCTNNLFFCSWISVNVYYLFYFIFSLFSHLCICMLRTWLFMLFLFYFSCLFLYLLFLIFLIFSFVLYCIVGVWYTTAVFIDEFSITSLQQYWVLPVRFFPVLPMVLLYRMLHACMHACRPFFLRAGKGLGGET